MVYDVTRQVRSGHRSRVKELGRQLPQERQAGADGLRRAELYLRADRDSAVSVGDRCNAATEGEPVPGVLRIFNA